MRGPITCCRYEGEFLRSIADDGQACCFITLRTIDARELIYVLLLAFSIWSSPLPPKRLRKISDATAIREPIQEEPGQDR